MQRMVPVQVPVAWYGFSITPSNVQNSEYRYGFREIKNYRSEVFPVRKKISFTWLIRKTRKEHQYYFVKNIDTVVIRTIIC